MADDEEEEEESERRSGRSVAFFIIGILPAEPASAFSESRFSNPVFRIRLSGPVPPAN